MLRLHSGALSMSKRPWYGRLRLPADIRKIATAKKGAPAKSMLDVNPETGRPLNGIGPEKHSLLYAYFGHSYVDSERPVPTNFYGSLDKMTEIEVTVRMSNKQYFCKSRLLSSEISFTEPGIE